MISQEIISKIVRSNPITDQLVTRGRLLSDVWYSYRRFVRNFGRLGMKKDEQKYSADLRIRVHAIEKGLSLANPRTGFGEEKIKVILGMVEYYKKTFKNQDFLIEIKSIMDSYFEFQKSRGHINKELVDIYSSLFVDVQNDESLGGIEVIKKEDVDKAILFDFDKFVRSRCAIRTFSSTPVNITQIKAALKIAEKTPSACNRQPWRVYVFRGQKKDDILKWQHGSMGFSEEIDSAILVCCNTQSYFMGEMNLPYVDGGLYAMTLLYALHSQGLGTIPLTMGLEHNKLETLYKRFGVKDNEVPILLIGVGNLKDEFEVAKSNRYSYDKYTTFVE